MPRSLRAFLRRNPLTAAVAAISVVVLAVLLLTSRDGGQPLQPVSSSGVATSVRSDHPATSASTADAQDPAAGKISEEQQKAALEYWTDERMAAAKPADTPAVTGTPTDRPSGPDGPETFVAPRIEGVSPEEAPPSGPTTTIQK